MQRIMLLTLMALLATALAAACGPARVDDQPATVQKLRLPMGFIADPQYAPYYVAVARGYYAEAGFEIEFDYSFETDGMALVGAGELPFAIVSGEQVLLARAQGLPVVYVLEWFQQYPIAVVSKAGAAIAAPADLAGRKIGLPGFFGASYVGYVGLLSANEIAPDAVQAEDIGFTQFEAVAADAVDAAVVYINNEPVRLAAEYDVNVIPVADYIDLVANGIVTNEATIADDPALVERFVHATLRGLADTLADPAAAFEISREFVAGLEDNRYPVLEASLPLWQAEKLGITDPASWETTQTLLQAMGLLEAPLDDLSAAYTNRFVESFAPPTE